MLSVRDLHVRYGRSVAALHGVDLAVPDDGVLAVLGSNGAGKSTLLRAISGTLRLHRGLITGGEIRFGDRRIDRLDPAAIVRRGVVGAPEGRQVFTRMTVEENLRAGGITRSSAERATARRRVHELFPVLRARAHQRGGLLSGGEQQMLAIGRALMSAPRVLLLDEPSLGLAPRVVEQIARIIREIHAQGTAVVLVEQNAVMALGVADHAVVLEVGRVALSGSSEELSRSEDVRHLYLGGHAETRATAERGKHKALSRWDG
ncbi:ABC transporter ATP-binding protein [Amycolatopsis alkalitolerans]|uniref:ABC transporter ATP-binding protein n=1 Tax=Amycolatopsis alkalitolerans TaxID=2547244 RepID=A0A5C4M4C4_9PSEU|nr:ABC transporter ATP-binding protein [Amycolatopsis alkalitolerans]TNC27865.1 ABC transporter ATP-binding protein [Amycolatopsis alkalitolerans]